MRRRSSASRGLTFGSFGTFGISSTPMTILKRVPRVLSPRLLYTIARMGHGDEIVLADANFPSESVGEKTPGGVIRADGIGIPELLSAILELMPLDETAPPCILMGMMEEHKAAGWETPIWDDYRAIVGKIEGAARAGDAADVDLASVVPFEEVERFAFYDRAKTAFAVVATGESALYGNLILKKGVLPPEP